MRGVQTVTFNIIVCLSILFGFSAKASAVNTVQLTGIAVDEPLAMIVEIDGEGRLARDGHTYEHINKAGLGFKKGDIFEIPDNDPSKEEYVVILLNKGTDPSKISLVRIMEGGKIVFLDDDGNFAITGVYIESTDPNEPSSFVFDIGHASADRPFLVWTPDLVVGVRGTFFEIRPGATYGSYPTQVVGYNELDDAEVSDQDLLPATVQWDPDDVVIYLLDWKKLRALIEGGMTLPVGNLSAIPVAWADPYTSEGRIRLAYLAMHKPYSAAKLHEAFSTTSTSLSQTVAVSLFARKLGPPHTLSKEDLGLCLNCSDCPIFTMLANALIDLASPHLGANTSPEDIHVFLHASDPPFSWDVNLVLKDDDDDDEDDDDQTGTYSVGRLFETDVLGFHLTVNWGTPKADWLITNKGLVRLRKPGEVFGAFTRGDKVWVYNRSVKPTDDFPKRGKSFFKDKKKKVKKRKAKRHRHGHKVQVAVEAL